MRNITATFAVGAVLIAVIGALTLTQAPPRLVHVGAPGFKEVGEVSQSASLALPNGTAKVCQHNEVLPSGVSAIRFSIWAFFGSPVHVTAYHDGQVLTQGSRGANWTSDSVTVPVKPVNRTTSGVTLCVALEPNSEPMVVLGAETPAQQAAVLSERATPTAAVASGVGQTLKGRVIVEYLASGRGSWWSRIVSVARHMGLGRAFSGTWIAFLVAALMAAVGVLTVRLTLRERP